MSDGFTLVVEESAHDSVADVVAILVVLLVQQRFHLLKPFVDSPASLLGRV